MKKALVSMFAALAVSLWAQELASRFEVISIKPQPPPSGSGFSVSFGFQPGGRFVATGQSLGGLLPLAFRDGDRMRRPNEFLNVPSRAFGTLFSIEAKVGGEAAATPTTIDMFSERGVALIRSLLEERFKLQAHEEMREMSVSDVASIFTAVQEQLGMKLVSRKEVRSVVVIDHVEKPTED